jgi:hypothetical protein
MHFCYIDESGCNGRDLQHTQQPIFVSGGIILRDEGWNKTNKEFYSIINEYFNNAIPENFELHANELLSPTGEKFFLNHDRERRNKLVTDLLKLIKTRKHQIAYIGIDKNKLNNYNTAAIKDKDYIELKVPYLVAYDYLISLYDFYAKKKLGRSARSLVVIDEKEIFIEEIGAITEFRRYKAPLAQRIKWITEFSYPLNSKRNPMIQLSDLILFITRKYLEIENGYKNEYAKDVKEIYRGFYRSVDERLIVKSPIRQSEGKYTDLYNTFIDSITSLPSARWKSKKY